MTTQQHYAIIDELRAEVERRRRVYPRWVRHERIDEYTAKRRIELFEAAADLLETGRNTSRYTLDHIRTELRREQHLRDRLYPGWVREGRIDAREALQRTNALAQALRLIQERIDAITAPQGTLF